MDKIIKVLNMYQHTHTRARASWHAHTSEEVQQQTSQTKTFITCTNRSTMGYKQRSGKMASPSKQNQQSRGTLRIFIRKQKQLNIVKICNDTPISDHQPIKSSYGTSLKYVIIRQ